ncbi:MAG: phosphatidylglycerol lysyltransferase domain-containing protein [Candidatus Nanopelagicaceae bacterium]|nr:phosphatidylglycerol lysyltransferase domain-containing protein [Candidatus Nanopelagicaceae bacterium]
MKRPEGSRWKVVLAARVLLIIGAVGIASSTLKSFGRRLRILESTFPTGWPNLATAGAIIVGVLLIVLSFALARRNRAAYLLTQLLLLISISLDLLRGLYVVEAAAAAAIFIFLFLIRHEFYAKPVRRVISRALIVFGQMAFMSFLIGFILILAPDRLFGGEITISHIFETVLRGLVGLSGPAYFVSHREQDIFNYAMPSLGFLTIIVPVLTLLQPSPPKPHMSDADEKSLRALLAEFGERDSLGYFALREDKSIIWSNTRKAAITYRVVGGCALASGDPIGNPDAWPQVIHAFIDLCLKNGWTPASIGCSEEAGEIWVRETGMNALEIGDEAVVHVKAYDPESPRYRNVRQTSRRILKQNYTANIFRTSEISPEMRTILTENSKKWRGAATERGFMMGLGRIADSDEPELLIVTALKDGQVLGLLQFVPWGDRAISLDLMRRSPQADSGVNELMIDAVIKYSAENGIDHISLNFAAFRSAFERGAQLGAGPVIRSWRSILLFFSRWLQMETLYRFNSKFRPEWIPRYLIFRKNSDLPKLGLATLRAEAFLGSRQTKSKKTTSLG